MANEKFPGVHVTETPALPVSVEDVATSVPAFLGYTEKAQDGARSLTSVPTRVSSMQDVLRLFGGAPRRVFTRTTLNGTIVFRGPARDFLLHQCLQLYFDNGGGPCWIVSMGNYADAKHDASDFMNATNNVWDALAREQEPAIYAVPDAVTLSPTDYKTICEMALSQCQTLRNRVAILDVYDGWKPEIDEVITGPNGFRRRIDFGAEPSYGMAYYPWLNTSVVPPTDVTFMSLDTGSRAALANEIRTEATSSEADEIISAPPTPGDERRIHEALMVESETYRDAMAGLLKAINLLPPSAALAGVFARTDADFGVFKPPANVALRSVISPAVAISDTRQADLNTPADGYAVNAIRALPGRGVMVWGARTLDGNSWDYRYISVRRALIMLEQSILRALRAYVFEPNEARTWKMVQSMIENCLNRHWMQGAFPGATPTQAYDVAVGLGSTMTDQDILDGVMRVSVRVAIISPAEFHAINFTQNMQSA